MICRFAYRYDMVQAADSLFGEIHPNAFKLFSGPQSPFFAVLLEHLAHEIFYDAVFVPRKQVIDAIRAFEAARSDAIDREPPDEAVRANKSYARLVETGWLIEQVTGFKKLCDMDPAGRVVLEFLLDIKAGRLKSYGGEVIQVLSLLESVDKDPEHRAEALRGAARSSKSFLTHLRTLSAGMRKAEQAILSHRNFHDIFSTFFQDYVQKHLIEDYKLLHTKANPFRFRVRILDICDRLLEDEYKLRAISEAYVREARAGSMYEARNSAIAQLRQIINIFENIDGFLSVIEETNQRVEKRIRNTVRFLDSIQQTTTEKLEEAIGKLGGMDIEEISVNDQQSRMVLPEGGMHLYVDRAKRAEIVRTPVRTPEKSPQQRSYENALYAYRQRSQITPDHIDAFLNEHLADRDSIEATELNIRSLDDFFIFERLRSLGYAEGGKLSDKWSVKNALGSVDNGWISCINFIVTRKQDTSRNEL